MPSPQNSTKLKAQFATLAALLLTTLLLLGGCEYLPFGYVSISEIVANPAQYEGKSIKVRGTVSAVTKIPFVDIRYYLLSDNGSQIMVIPQGTLPASQAHVTVIGVLENITIIENQGFGFHIKETNRLD